jgi:hypothetical protein
MVPHWFAVQVRGVHEQSLSFANVQPAGQHPSPDEHWVIWVSVQIAVQDAALPARLAVAHVDDGVHWLGQFPSHVSPASTTPFPHVGEQSLSVSKVQPAAQHPSPLAHCVMVVATHCAVQASALPRSSS